VLSPEESGQYAAEILDAHGDPIGSEPTWSVSNPTLASIDASGALTTTNAGVGTIYVIAEAGEVRDSVALRITSSWTRVSVGEGETCAYDINRHIWCWGTFAGTGQPANGLVPTRVASDEEFSDVAGGVISACGVVNGDGSAYCWGTSVYNSLGVGVGTNASTPQPVTGGFLFDHVVLGREHGCGLNISQQIVCWGKNVHGEVGDSIAGTLSIGHSPTVVVGGHNWKEVTAKGYRSCGLTTAGKVYCWGANHEGVAGWPAAVTDDVTFPVALEADRTYDALQMGPDFQCGRIGTTLECWGNAMNGHLGNGTTANTLVRVPEAVSGNHAFGEFSTGESHSCAIDTDGKAWCWGDRALGHATIESSAVPVAVAGNHRFLFIAAGSTQSCGVTVGRALYCWGEGSLGDGVPHAGGSLTPVRVRDP
jgi:alpha-tubulin suppressor-like RCC1 family protein